MPPDNQTTIQNPISEENSIPPSPSSSDEGSGRTKQEPTPPSHEATEGQGEQGRINSRRKYELWQEL